MRRSGTNRARELRAFSTGPERKLWDAIRGRRMGGFYFRRQRRIGPYFADFVCLEAELIIEIDGRGHDGEDPHEAARTAYLEDWGFTILRFSNEDVLHEFEGVLTAIGAALPDRRAPSP